MVHVTMSWLEASHQSAWKTFTGWRTNRCEVNEYSKRSKVAYAKASRAASNLHGTNIASARCKSREKLRNAIPQGGHEAYLVDESRKECKCSAFGPTCNTFGDCEGPRPFRHMKIFRHGLSKCNTCSRLRSTEIYAATSTWGISMSVCNSAVRSSYFQRA